MVTFTPHFLLQYGGTLGSGEIWSNNIRLCKDGLTLGSSTGDLLGLDVAGSINDITNDVKALITDSGANISSNVVLRYVKFNAIRSDGHYASDSVSNTKFLDGAAAVAGASSAPMLPYQCSVAVSWVTAQARGRASKGRIFPPGPTTPVDAQGKITPAKQNDIAVAYKTFLNALGNWPGLDLTSYRPFVMSGVDGSKNPITSVRVGAVPDTMRSRRNALTENYVSVNL